MYTQNDYTFDLQNEPLGDLLRNALETILDARGSLNGGLPARPWPPGAVNLTTVVRFRHLDPAVGEAWTQDAGRSHPMAAERDFSVQDPIRHHFPTKRGRRASGCRL